MTALNTVILVALVNGNPVPALTDVELSTVFGEANPPTAIHRLGESSGVVFTLPKAITQEELAKMYSDASRETGLVGCSSTTYITGVSIPVSERISVKKVAHMLVVDCPKQP